MWKTKFPSDALQREELALERINEDEMAMTFQITVAKEYLKKPDIDAEADFAKHHRPHRPPKRLDENPETTAVLNVY